MGNQLLSINVAKRPQDPPPKLEGAGSYLLAWDPVNNKEVWKQPKGSSRAGAMATAGNLVFQGSGSTFSAFRADTGEQVWTTETQANIVGGSADLRGRRRAVRCRGGAPGRVVSSVVQVAIGRRTTRACWSTSWVARRRCPRPSSTRRRRSARRMSPARAAQLAKGEALYNANCNSCQPNSGRVEQPVPGSALRRADPWCRGVQGDRDRWGARAERHGVASASVLKAGRRAKRFPGLRGTPRERELAKNPPPPNPFGGRRRPRRRGEHADAGCFAPRRLGASCRPTFRRPFSKTTEARQPGFGCHDGQRPAATIKVRLSSRTVVSA